MGGDEGVEGCVVGFFVLGLEGLEEGCDSVNVIVLN